MAPAIAASSNGRPVVVGSRDPQRAQVSFVFAPDIVITGDFDSLINDPQAIVKEERGNTRYGR